MTVAGEEADVSPQTLESWKERSKGLIKGWKPENVWNMDKTGCFWKGIPDVSLSEKGKRCRGDKQLKQRNTCAFFVNAAGGEEDPIIIGLAVQLRCFKHLTDRKRPYGCYYFSNKKAWMTNDIMDNILSSLNQHLQ